MKNIFTSVNAKKPSSNTFDLSHDVKMSFQMGQLTPIHVQECIPGDIIRMNTSQMLRFAPMIAPVMHRINVYTHFFFVPNRLMWDNWESFITGGEDGEDASVFPRVVIDEVLPEGSLGDYLGLPTGVEETYEASCLPVVAYFKIFNEFFRDQNLIPEIPTIVDDGNNAQYLNFLQQPCVPRAWAHDYFTSALPWTQKGPEATIPLGETAPIIWKDPPEGQVTNVRDIAGNPILANSTLVTENTFGALQSQVSGVNTPALLDNHDQLLTDLSDATASTINDLRRAFKLQEWLEKNARGGSRYTESILSHFGVRSSDARLQRPEFLGGGKAPVTISEVLQTSETTEPTPQGNMAGHGISVGGAGQFKYFAEEHGYIIGLMSVLPKTSYFQGLPRHYFKFDKFDYYWPSFAHIGEQPIYNKEIYIDSSEVQEQIFGYTPRYAEYKFMLSRIHGEFKTTLDFWTMVRKFDEQPTLSAEFISCIPTTRIFAVEEQSEHMYAHIFHRIKATRRMPFFGSPKM